MGTIQRPKHEGNSVGSLQHQSSWFVNLNISISDCLYQITKDCRVYKGLLMDWAWRSPYPAAVELARSPFPHPWVKVKKGPSSAFGGDGNGQNRRNRSPQPRKYAGLSQNFRHFCMLHPLLLRQFTGTAGISRADPDRLPDIPDIMFHKRFHYNKSLIIGNCMESCPLFVL